MYRDFKKLREGPFDVLIIGGGIYGAWSAYDAAARGLKTAVVDKADWASGTSSASSKLIHGGLRYLEHYDFRLVKTSLTERRLLSKIGPHKVLPQSFAVPLYKDLRVGPIRMKAGLLLYDWLAGRDQPVKPHKFFRAGHFCAQFPFLKSDNIRAGFTYGDCFTDDARLVLEVMQGALNMGAAAVNYASVKELLFFKKQVIGAVIEDQETGEICEVRAGITVNAAGPWNEELLKTGREKRYTRWAKGIHLIMPPLPCGNAFLIMTKDGKRIFFLIPWYGKTILGTTDTDYSGNPDDVCVKEDDINYLLREVNRLFNGFQWEKKDISGQFAGLRSLRNVMGKSPSAVTREWSMEIPYKGMIMPVGGKLTSARADAAQIIDWVCKKGEFPRHQKSRPTMNRPLPWSPGDKIEDWKKRITQKGMDAGLSEENIKWGMFRYGISFQNVLEIAANDPDSALPIINGLPFCMAEVFHCARNEMVVHLEDLIRRRIPLLLLHKLAKETVAQIAVETAHFMNWSQEKQVEEVEAVCRKWNIT